jgi:putative transcriptional regulator
MKTHIKLTKGRVNEAFLDATTEADIALQIQEDQVDSMIDAAKYTRSVRHKLGFSQTQLAQHIGVSIDTIRNWEQGKRTPVGAAKALYRVLDREPEAALSALGR